MFSRLNFFSTFVAIWISTISVLAQNSTELKDDVNWTRIQSPKLDLSLSIPEGFLVDNEDGEYRIYSYFKGVTLRVEMREMSDPKARLNQMFSNPRDDVDYKKYEIGDFLLYRQNSKENETSMSLYLASSKVFYRVWVSGKDKNEAIFKRFLNSIQIGNKLLFTQTEAAEQTETVIRIDTLKTSAVVF